MEEQRDLQAGGDDREQRLSKKLDIPLIENQGGDLFDWDHKIPLKCQFQYSNVMGINGEWKDRQFSCEEFWLPGPPEAALVDAQLKQRIQFLSTVNSLSLTYPYALRYHLVLRDEVNVEEGPHTVLCFLLDPVHDTLENEIVEGRLFSFQEMVNLMADISKLLIAFKEQKIHHLEITPSSIVMLKKKQPDEPTIYSLAHWGLEGFIKTGFIPETINDYKAPDVNAEHPEENLEKIDLYSLVLCALEAFGVPFAALSLIRTDFVQKEPFILKKPSDGNQPELIQYIAHMFLNCLLPEAQNRYSFDQLLSAFDEIWDLLPTLDLKPQKLQHAMTQHETALPGYKGYKKREAMPSPLDKKQIGEAIHAYQQSNKDSPIAKQQPEEQDDHPENPETLKNLNEPPHPERHEHENEHENQYENEHENGHEQGDEHDYEHEHEHPQENAPLSPKRLKATAEEKKIGDEPINVDDQENSSVAPRKKDSLRKEPEATKYTDIQLNIEDEGERRIPITNEEAEKLPPKGKGESPSDVKGSPAKYQEKESPSKQPSKSKYEEEKISTASQKNKKASVPQDTDRNMLIETTQKPQGNVIDLSQDPESNRKGKENGPEDKKSEKAGEKRGEDEPEKTTLQKILASVYCFVLVYFIVSVTLTSIIIRGGFTEAVKNKAAWVVPGLHGLGYLYQKGPITDISVVAATATCPDGTESTIGTWPGVQRFCYNPTSNPGSFSLGICPIDECMLDCRQYQPGFFQNITSWRYGKFCITRAQYNVTSSSSCANGYNLCGNNLCVSTTKCPISSIAVESVDRSTSASWTSTPLTSGRYLNYIRAPREKTLADLNLTIGGTTLCVADDYLPETDSTRYPGLRVKETDCGAYGVANNTDIIDSDPYPQSTLFQNQPWWETVNVLPELSNYLNENVQLAGVYYYTFSANCSNFDPQAFFGIEEHIQSFYETSRDASWAVVFFILVFDAVIVAFFIRDRVHESRLTLYAEPGPDEEDRAKKIGVFVTLFISLITLVVIIGMGVLDSKRGPIHEYNDRIQEAGNCFAETQPQTIVKDLADLVSIRVDGTRGAFIYMLASCLFTFVVIVTIQVIKKCYQGFKLLAQDMKDVIHEGDPLYNPQSTEKPQTVTQKNVQA